MVDAWVRSRLPGLQVRLTIPLPTPTAEGRARSRSQPAPASPRRRAAPPTQRTSTTRFARPAGRSTRRRAGRWRRASATTSRGVRVHDDARAASGRGGDRRRRVHGRRGRRLRAGGFDRSAGGRRCSRTSSRTSSSRGRAAPAPAEGGAGDQRAVGSGGARSRRDRRSCDRRTADNDQRVHESRAGHPSPGDRGARVGR